MRHLKKVSNYDNGFEQMSQQELLQKLSDLGISVTSQTLRNWELIGLISVPARTGLKGKRGLRVIYNAINIVEAFIIWTLTHCNDINDPTMSRCSLKQIKIARYMFLKLKISVKGERILPQDYYKIEDQDEEIENLIADCLDIKVNKNGECQVNVNLNGNINSVQKRLFISNLLITYVSLFFEGLLIVNDWEACVGT